MIELHCGMKGSDDAEQQIKAIKANLMSGKNRRQSKKIRMKKIKQMSEKTKRTIKKVGSSQRTTEIKQKIVSNKKADKNSRGSKRVVAGERSDPGEWPWQVLLNYTETENLYCGGAILSKHFILTASHCFRKNKSFLNFLN